MSLPVRARRRRAARHFLLPLPLALSACCLLLLHLLPQASAFARFTPGNVLLLDHLNLNHERGRHDLVKAFYFEVLGLSADPRKAENLDKGRKTLWANAGITQFHLPEADRPQVFDGLITLAYPSEERLQRAVAALQDPPAVLAGTSFEWRQQQEGEEGGAVLVTDPWGTRFRLVVDAGAADVRGRQPGAESLPVAMSDLCVHVPRDASLPGIARFYRHVLGAPATTTTDARGDTVVVSVVVSPQQTLTFRHAPIATSGPAATPHEDLERDEQQGGAIVANHGPHVSVYVRDLAASYRRAAELGATFVNTRFKRKAYSLPEALDQAMFRCLDIVDPSNRAAGPILRLEHEVRSMTNADGSKYKSCPFDTVPPPAV